MGVRMLESGELRCLCSRMGPSPPSRGKFFRGQEEPNPIPTDGSGGPGGDFPLQGFRTPLAGNTKDGRCPGELCQPCTHVTFGLTLALFWGSGLELISGPFRRRFRDSFWS